MIERIIALLGVTLKFVLSNVTAIPAGNLQRPVRAQGIEDENFIGPADQLSPVLARCWLLRCT